MNGIGIPELLIVLVILIILFGPSRLAGAGKAIGEAISSFRRELRTDDSTTPPSNGSNSGDQQL